MRSPEKGYGDAGSQKSQYSGKYSSGALSSTYRYTTMRSLDMASQMGASTIMTGSVVLPQDPPKIQKITYSKHLKVLENCTE